MKRTYVLIAIVAAMIAATAFAIVFLQPKQPKPLSNTISFDKAMKEPPTEIVRYTLTISSDPPIPVSDENFTLNMEVKNEEGEHPEHLTYELTVRDKGGSTVFLDSWHAMGGQPYSTLRNLQAGSYTLSIKLKFGMMSPYHDPFETTVEFDVVSARALRFSFLQEMIKKTKSVYTSALFIGILLDENKEYAEKKVSREPLLEEKALNMLKPLLVERFKKVAEDGTLLKTKHSLDVLFRWKEWGSENDVTTFIDRIIESKKGLVELLSIFISQVYSTAGNYKTLNKKTIDEYYDLKKIEKLVTNISNQDLMVMNESEKEAVELFRNPPKTHLFN